MDKSCVESYNLILHIHVDITIDVCRYMQSERNRNE